MIWDLCTVMLFYGMASMVAESLLGSRRSVSISEARRWENLFGPGVINVVLAVATMGVAFLVVRFVTGEPQNSPVHWIVWLPIPVAIHALGAALLINGDRKLREDVLREWIAQYQRRLLGRRYLPGWEENAPPAEWSEFDQQWNTRQGVPKSPFDEDAIYRYVLKKQRQRKSTRRTEQETDGTSVR